MTDYVAIYDRQHGITRDSSGRALAIDPVDSWWNASVSDGMDVYRIGDSLICAAGWNGEAYAKSFRVADRFTAADSEVLTLRPVYRFQDEERDPDEDAEDDFDVIGFDVSH